MHPFSQHREETIASVGEVRLLQYIREWLGGASPSSPRGMGDDCAVSDARINLLTNDSLAYLRHFDDNADPVQAGSKLLKRCLSDIAAMGGQPEDALVALFLPPHTRLEWLERFTHGLSRCAIRYSTRIAGGDLTETDSFLAATLSLTGWSPRPLLRTGAEEGDWIYVTGTLGGSIRGHHLVFEPRLAEGNFLARRESIHSCIDVTDGLAKDLFHILDSDLAAEIAVESLPPSDPCKSAWGDNQEKLLEHMLTDGEDYELLFTLGADEDLEAFEADWSEHLRTRVSRIGRIVSRGEAPALRRPDGTALTTKGGYEHFGAS